MPNMSDRRQAIMQTMSGGTTAPDETRKPKRRQAIMQALGRGRAQGGQKMGRAAVASAAQPELGGQLSRRVQSGAISEDQAQQTAGDRRQLEAAYGPDWRVKVFGDRGYVQRTRQALTENPDDPQAQALYTALMTQRQQALERAPGVLMRKTPPKRMPVVQPRQRRRRPAVSGGTPVGEY